MRIEKLELGGWPFGGWAWRLRKEDEPDRWYATDQHGCGLWELTEGEGERSGKLCATRQVFGTCQFRVPVPRSGEQPDDRLIAKVRRAIRRQMGD